MSAEESNLSNTEQISADSANPQTPRGMNSDEEAISEQLGIKYIYNHDKLIRASIHPSLYLDANIVELLKEVSYRDEVDDPERLTISQIESFVEAAIYEKIDRSLLEYTKLGQNYSGKLQKKYKHFVTEPESIPEKKEGVRGLLSTQEPQRQKNSGSTAFTA